MTWIEIRAFGNNYDRNVYGVNPDILNAPDKYLADCAMFVGRAQSLGFNRCMIHLGALHKDVEGWNDRRYQFSTSRHPVMGPVLARLKQALAIYRYGGMKFGAFMSPWFDGPEWMGGRVQMSPTNLSHIGRVLTELEQWKPLLDFAVFDEASISRALSDTLHKALAGVGIEFVAEAWFIDSAGKLASPAAFPQQCDYGVYQQNIAKNPALKARPGDKLSVTLGIHNKPTPAMVDEIRSRGFDVNFIMGTDWSVIEYAMKGAVGDS